MKSSKLVLLLGVVLFSAALVVPRVLAEDPAKNKDVVDTAVAAGDFKTLAKLLTAAGLVETLKCEGPFTVFAPTDAAFAKLPKETLEDLQKPESKDKLKAILTYHVAKGKMMAADVMKAKTIMTVNGAELTVTVKDKDVLLDDAKVTKTDIDASNGVIHVIDTVMMPKETQKAEK